MGKEKRDTCCCLPGGGTASCFWFESVVSVNERGQMVLPKEMRDRVGIVAAEKLAAISSEKDGKACCISLIKAADLTEMISGLTRPHDGRYSR